MAVEAVAQAQIAASPDVAGRRLLRVLTCGSVDNGKSTLIGRLLHECGAVFEDQLAALASDSRRYGTTGENLDYALLLDGLEAEREQGITIDVAYRYFATPKCSFIIADTPGHEQYTRNMATGASGSDAAIILIDARRGVTAQSRRHAVICSLLGIRHVVLAVNKMDLVDHAQATFDRYRPGFPRFRRAAVVHRRHADTDVGPPRRQCRRSEPQHGLVRRSAAAANAWNRSRSMPRSKRCRSAFRCSG